MTGRVGWGLLTAAVLAFMLVPVALVVVFSFADQTATQFPIRGLSLRWYGQLWASAEFRRALTTSLSIALPVGAVATVTGTMAAMALGHFASRPAAGLLLALALPMMVPPLLLALSLVVLFVTMLGLPLGRGAVILAHLVVTQPVVVLIVAARLRRFDPTLVEAARDLGAGPWLAFRKVTLPIVASTLVGAALVAMAISLDDIVLTFFTIGSGNTLPTYVWGKLRTTLDPSINAIATLLLAFTTAAAIVALRASRYRG